MCLWSQKTLHRRGTIHCKFGTFCIEPPLKVAMILRQECSQTWSSTFERFTSISDLSEGLIRWTAKPCSPLFVFQMIKRETVYTCNGLVRHSVPCATEVQTKLGRVRRGKCWPAALGLEQLFAAASGDWNIISTLDKARFQGVVSIYLDLHDVGTSNQSSIIKPF